MWLIQTKHVAATYSLVQRVKDLMRMWEKKKCVGEERSQIRREADLKVDGYK